MSYFNGFLTSGRLQPDHVRVESSGFPWGLVSFNPPHVTCSPPIRNEFESGGITKFIHSLVYEHRTVSFDRESNSNLQLNRPFYSCVLSCLAMNASEAGGDLALIKTSLLFSSMICTIKVVRSVSKQGQLQPRCHSEAMSLRRQL